VEFNALIFKPQENAQQGPIWPVWSVRLANLRLRHQASLFLSVRYCLAIPAHQWKHSLAVMNKSMLVPRLSLPNNHFPVAFWCIRCSAEILSY